MKLFGKIKWLYRLGAGVEIDTQLRPFEEVRNEWGILGTNGKLFIRAGYAWDGCSPKIVLFDWFVFGTFDGPPDEGVLPKSWKSSGGHDWAYQHKTELIAAGITRKDVDKEFYAQLKAANVPWIIRVIYYRAVRALGWLWWRR
jgi:hypothetical protein